MFIVDLISILDKKKQGSSELENPCFFYLMMSFLSIAVYDCHTC